MNGMTNDSHDEFGEQSNEELDSKLEGISLNYLFFGA
jgi:hypothetical protein